ncbi:MAG: 16S rRNA (adenine(1518)-N(6)/adenine(1519)-N(6))-dimethyltransferase RsmA [Treponema sp.]|jgi:16S rRNA (adenine1518-N6/adenine1519-N6)-dimethyltransferase|nr:16S rRNA (adenine(1518)-N(6)/adenine(1519)-N(6))-dimethyltransferase RsmA [Treponema sp.]
MALNYNSPLELRRFLDERGLGMRKRYGQNFLINGRARETLLDALGAGPGGPGGGRVWEIGPGLGAMTAGLLDRGALVTAFEIDPGFITVLRELFGARPGFSLIPGDVLKTWKTAPAHEGDYFLGNLPYTIAAVLLGDLIEGKRFFRRMVVTVQKEMARRMAARRGSPDYSSFSLLCGSAYTVRPLMELKGASFYPEPRVDSQGVLLELRTDVDPRSYPGQLYPLVRALFSSRRKTVKNNLRRYLAPRFPGSQADAQCGAVLQAAGISEMARAETLMFDDFLALAQSLEAARGNP